MPGETCSQCISRETCANVFHFRKKGIPLDNAWCVAWKQEKMPTNGDKIRKMDNDQLSERLFMGCKMCGFEYKGEGCSVDNCHEGLVKWLNQEATQ